MSNDDKRTPWPTDDAGYEYAGIRHALRSACRAVCRACVWTVTMVVMLGVALAMAACAVGILWLVGRIILNAAGLLH